jgi:spore coat protein CotH
MSGWDFLGQSGPTNFGMGGYNVLGSTPGIMSGTMADPGSFASAGGVGSMATAGGGLGGAAGGMGAMGAVGAGISAIQSLASMWMGFKQMKMAQKQFKFEKKMANQNLINQMKTYNTALADRARSRGVMEGQSPDQVADYIRSNSLYKGDPLKGKTTGMVNDTITASLNNYNAISGGKGSYAAPAGATSLLNPAAAPAAAARPAGGGGLSSYSALAASAAPASRGAAERTRDDDRPAG